MPHMHTPSSSVLVKKAFEAAITAAVTTGTWLPVLGYRVGMAIIFATPSGAGTTSDVALWQADDASGTNPVVVTMRSPALNPQGGTSAAFKTVTTALGATVEVMDINFAYLTKPYITLIHTGAGGSAAGQAAGLILFFEPGEAAVTQDVAAVQIV